ncbi:MAG: hypothetical protein E7374_02760 [Clostridiales bacterium]|nr:hypothetical protein [Clostridiales bacterium]
MMKLKKRNASLCLMLVLMLLLMIVIAPAETYCLETNTTSQIEEELNESIVNELDAIDFKDLSKVIEEFNEKNTNLFSLGNLKEKVYEVISGENAVNYSSFFASLFSNVIDKVVRYLPMLSLIIAIGVIGNLLNGVKSKFNEKSTSNLIHLVCFMVVAILVIAMVSSLAIDTGQSIDSMVSQMNVLFPILLTLMVGIGAHASVGVFQPVVAIISTYVADIFNFFIMPLFMFSFVFGIISNISDNVKVDKFSSFVSGLFKWTVGIVFTIFFAVFSLQGITAGKFDSLSIRTTKYTIKSYVPVMGGYLSDGMDLILASSVLIKNSIGLVGILLIITTILSPILDIVIFSLMMKLISAVLQPMGNSKLSNFLSSTSKSVTMLSTCLIAVGFMYLISIGLVMTTSVVV